MNIFLEIAHRTIVLAKITITIVITPIWNLVDRDVIFPNVKSRFVAKLADCIFHGAISDVESSLFA